MEGRIMIKVIKLIKFEASQPGEPSSRLWVEEEFWLNQSSSSGELNLINLINLIIIPAPQPPESWINSMNLIQVLPPREWEAPQVGRKFIKFQNVNELN